MRPLDWALDVICPAVGYVGAVVLFLLWLDSCM